MNTIIELETADGKSVRARIKAKTLVLGEKLALKRHKNCTIVDSYEDRKQSRRAMSKDRW